MRSLWNSVILAVILSCVSTSAAISQQINLRIFTGGQQRPDVTRKILDLYQSRNPNVKVEIEIGGATSEMQQQYLNTVLASKDSTLDVIVIDVIRPAQWAAAQWAEPLDAYLGAEKDSVMKQYLPAYREANIVNGKVMALPYFADAQFLYYRKDLLEKHGVAPPATWTELIAGAKKVLAFRPQVLRSRGRSAPIWCRCGAQAAH
jgi:multiple sugar transport system substrate-binding protein